MDALPRYWFEGTRCLQFSPDPALDRTLFREFMVSVWGGENSLDMQAIALPDASYDFIYSSHVINHIPDTAAALREMLRVVGSGVIVLNVGGTAFSYLTRDSEQYCGPDRQFKVYGTEYAHELQRALPEVAVLEVVALDPCCLMLDSVYLASEDEARLREMAQAAAGRNVHVQVYPALSPKAVAERKRRPVHRDDPWGSLRSEIEALKEETGNVTFWVRDDDGTVPSDRLIELIELCKREAVPLCMAVIPLPMTLDLVDLICSHPHVTPIQHGFDHNNRETVPDKPKSEFPSDRSSFEALRSIQLGWHVMNEAFGKRALPVFCPPWGTIAPKVRDGLPGLGFAGFSASRVAGEMHRRGNDPASLKHASAHVAVNKAKRDGSPPLGEQRILEVLAATVRAIRLDGSREPIGIMTHHWGVDEEVRDFLKRLFDTTRGAGANWQTAEELFMPRVASGIVAQSGSAEAQSA